MEDKLRYSFKLGLDQAWNLLLCVLFLFFGVTFFIFAFEGGPDYKFALLGSFFFFIGLYPVIVFTNYLQDALGKTVEIYLDTGSIEIRKNGHIKLENLSNVRTIEIVESFETRLFPYSFAYVKYYFQSGDSLTLTTLMDNSFFIPEDIDPTLIETFFPFVTNRYRKPLIAKTDLEKLLEQYQELSESKLNDILKDDSGYRRSAKIAATKVLKERKTAYNKR